LWNFRWQFSGAAARRQRFPNVAMFFVAFGRPFLMRATPTSAYKNIKILNI